MPLGRTERLRGAGTRGVVYTGVVWGVVGGLLGGRVRSAIGVRGVGGAVAVRTALTG